LISVIILTKNEEHDLPGCLDSVSWSDDVYVYDSGSTDHTAGIAKSYGAKVVVRPSESGAEIFGGNEAEHKNWALKNIPFKHPWVLHLDADERVTPELAESMQQAAQGSSDFAAFRIRRRDFWGDRWLKHVVASSYYLRLFRPDKMRYERLINPVSVPDGPVAEVIGFLDHFPFRKGVTCWLKRHNSYSSLEAEQFSRNRTANRQFSLKRAFLAKDPNERRFHQKELFYRMPFRPLVKFVSFYFGKRGFLDGAEGFQYAVLQSFYEYMIVLKSRELVKKVTFNSHSEVTGLTAEKQKPMLSETRNTDSVPFGATNR
jgi:glycosyltransferase involved in cell wall biosynthesis